MACAFDGGHAQWYRSRFTMSINTAAASDNRDSGPGRRQLHEHRDAWSEAVLLPSFKPASSRSTGLQPREHRPLGLQSHAGRRHRCAWESMIPSTVNSRHDLWSQIGPTLRYVTVDASRHADPADVPRPVGHRARHQLHPGLHDRARPAGHFSATVPGHSSPYFWNDQQAPHISLPRNSDLPPDRSSPSSMSSMW